MNLAWLIEKQKSSVIIETQASYQQSCCEKTTVLWCFSTHTQTHTPSFWFLEVLSVEVSLNDPVYLNLVRVPCTTPPKLVV